MSVALAEAVQRDRLARSRPAPILPASAYLLSGAELARECVGALRALPAARILSDGERDAVAAIMAERVMGRMAEGMRGRPRDVLRYVDRIMRFPALYAHADSGVPRSAVGRDYLRLMAAGILRDSREWRDLAESYQTATERAAERGPMIESAESYADADALTRASAREVERSTGEPLPAVPIMSADVAEGMALALAVDGASIRDARVAVLMAAGVPLASVAVHLGCSLVTAKRASAKGSAWVRANYGAGELVALLRDVAESYGHTVPADPCVPTLPPMAHAARLAVDGAKREALRSATLAGSGC